MSDGRIAAVEQACADLLADGAPVTFVSVAARSGVPRVTLYRNDALRSVVDEHRARGREANSLLGLAGEVANLRLGLEALAERVRNHEEQLRLLNRSRRKSG